MSNKYKEIEQKWQNFWYKNNLYEAKDNNLFREKKYILVEFPFPSGSSLHVGHCYRYTVPDIFSRFLRMQGCNVMFPLGWDAFGLPTEEFARKTGANPIKVTKENIQTLKADLQSMGYGIDWTREVNTTDPNFYKWTQWIFGQFFQAGLAQQQEVELWWCPNLGTVLANEEVLDDENGNKISERGGHPVEKKKMLQWVLKMPEYAEALLEGLDIVDYPQSIKTMQENWIGKSEGVVVSWEVIENE